MPRASTWRTSIPAALEDAINAELAPRLQARIISEAANGPTTREAADILFAKGTRVLPDILANAGGVVVSYFEWVQNRQEYYWTLEEVTERMTTRLTDAYREVADRARQRSIPLRRAAYEIAAERVAKAAFERGVQ